MAAGVVLASALGTAVAVATGLSVGAAITRMTIILDIVIGVPSVVALYFFPTIVAKRRHHHHVGAIAAFNFFLGWTVIGWVGALAMALSAG